MSSLWPVNGSGEEILALLRDWDAAPTAEPLIVETSGSTGRPKRVVLSRDALRASAAATHERLGGPGRWVLNLPPQHVAGLQVLFRCVVAGLDPMVLPGSLAEPPPGGRTYLSLVPTQLIRRLRDDVEMAALARFDAVLIGGGPLAPSVRQAAEDRGVRIVQTYGMSETCGGCVYDGVPLAGVDVKVEDGEIWLRGPMLFDRYDGDPMRTAHVLVDGWFHTDDLGTFVDGRLRVEGRADDVVISGGVKVPTVAVAVALAAAPGVRDVAVVGVPDSEWGERVVAVVESDVEIALAGLRDLVEPRAWAPRALLIVEELPRLANGKPDRARIKELAASA